MITPQSLKQGDTVAIVSPAGALSDYSIAEQAIERLRSWGLNVIMSSHTLTREGYYSGNIKERTDDIVNAIENKDIKAILCSYGGYGCIHLLERFTEAIRQNPKWVMGMSDCTLLLAGCMNAGIESIHSAQCRQLAYGGNNTANNTLRNILFGSKTEYNVPSHRLNVCGTANGMLAGGNLSIICSLIGTPYNILHKDIILFIEDINEPPYRIERMMYQLKLSGALPNIKGVIVGQFTGTKEQFGIGSAYDVIHGIITDYNIPVCFNFPVGHCENNMPMVVGANIELTVTEVGCTIRRK